MQTHKNLMIECIINFSMMTSKNLKKNPECHNQSQFSFNMLLLQIHVIKFKKEIKKNSKFNEGKYIINYIGRVVHSP